MKTTPPAKLDNPRTREALIESSPDWQRARMLGRREALNIIIEQSAEDFPDDFQRSRALGDTGDYMTEWNVEKLEELLDAKEPSSLIEHLDGCRWEMDFKLTQITAELAALKAEVEQTHREYDEMKRLRDFANSAIEHIRLEKNQWIEKAQKENELYLKEHEMANKLDAELAALRQPDPYARLKAYVKAGARIRCGGNTWRKKRFWNFHYLPEKYEVHPDDLHMCPEYAPQATMRMEAVPQPDPRLLPPGVQAYGQAPAAEPEPATFRAHGKTWTRHTPGDPMPCDGEANVYVAFHDGTCSKADLAKAWSWDKSLPECEWIIGWRYAEAQPEPAAQPWTPAVGDTVRLKSGGPVMTVTDVRIEPNKDVRAVFANERGIHVCILQPACLTP